MRTLHIFGGGIYVDYMSDLAQRHGFNVLVRTSGRLESSFQLTTSDRLEVLSGDNISDLMNIDNMPIERDIGISFSAPWILGSKVISRFAGNLYNLHGQALPLFRGAGGYSWNIMERSKLGGISIHRLTSEIDAGEIISQRKFDFPSRLKTPKEYEAFAQNQAFELLCEWFELLLSQETLDAVNANSSESSTYWPRLNTPIHGWINWSWPSADIVSFIDAFSDPYSGAQSYLGKVPVTVHGSSIEEYKGVFHPFQYGLITRIIDGTYFVAHQDGFITLKRISPVDSSIHLNVRLGDRLYTPYGILDEAMSTRIQYAPNGAVKYIGHTG